MESARLHESVRGRRWHRCDGGHANGAAARPDLVSVLAPVLLYSSAKQVSRFMSGIEAVLVELMDQPDSWNLFGDPMLAQTMNTFGFRPQVPGGATTSR